MLDISMTHSGRGLVAIPVAALAAAGLACVLGGPARAQEMATGPCAAAIRSVLADIARRDLDTSAGPPLNAFITLNPSALAQAEALDRKTAAGEPRGPMFCTPVAVKDNFDTYDMPTTVGSLALIGNQPERDAPFVARLRKAGAIIVGKTNMDELAMGIRGLSGAGGRVGNAYDTAQSAGGSSAGSGAAVGAGFVPFALGSDNCGSLRIPAVYNGAVSLRASYGRFNTDGIFPIGFVNGVPGVIARDTPMLNAALAIVGDGWRADSAVASIDSLRGRRIGLLRRFDDKSPWSPGAADAQKLFAHAVALMRNAGAEIVDDVALENFDARLGAGFMKGFARKVDAAYATFPAARRDWRDICTSQRIRPEWSAAACMAAGATDARLEQQAVAQIAGNQRKVVATMDRLRLDALLYPADGRGGAREDESPDVTCYIAGASGLPAAAFPVGLDARGLPVGLELLGRPQSDEMLVALMGAFEGARGPLPEAKRTHSPVEDGALKAPGGRADLAALDIARQNELRLRLGWSAFRSRKGADLGALAPAKFRTLTEELVKAALEGP
jgi:Asp-tRNA(Asn)/Glu-tRNA(Gln) amidotransferase A subunit family amidase